MNQQEALNLIIGAVRTANRRGAFEVEESADINQAIKAFTEEPEKEPKPDMSTLDSPNQL